MIGTTLSHFKITAKLGEGGMGEVYRARDGKLDREVAIKVLPADFVRDPERLARFEREAKVLASLNHQNIAAIYQVEQVEGTTFLVMELVEGETLAELVARGAIPVDEALPIALQIAEALEVAHEKGVIHRDLKPANVKLTPEGLVKVLDFGLAKAWSPETSASATPSMSPTLTAQMTQTGVILGTAAYMAPEQAKGRPVDRRVDVWAFGAVLWEMLVGRRLFSGDSVAEVLAAVLRSDVDLDALPPHTPAGIRRLLQRCLRREPRSRQRDIGDVRIVLEESLAGSELAPAGGTAGPGRARPGLVAGGLLLAVGVALGAGLVSWLRAGRSAEPGSITDLAIPIGTTLRVSGTPLLAPDGRTAIFRAVNVDPREPDHLPRLYIRHLEGSEVMELPGSKDVAAFALSPDGKWIALVARTSDRNRRRQLLKVPLDLAVPPVKIADWPVWADPFNLLWPSEATILALRRTDKAVLPFSPNGGPPGTPVEIRSDPGVGAKSGATSSYLRFSSVLPKGGQVLVTFSSFESGAYQQRVGVLDPGTGDFHEVVEDGSNAWLAPTGHLLFTRRDAILAAPFDLERLVVTAGAQAVTDGLWAEGLWTGGLFSLSAAGDLLYGAGTVQESSRSLVFLSREGETTTWSEDHLIFNAVWVSPDGKRLAVQVDNIAEGEALLQIRTSDIERPRLVTLGTRPGEDCGQATWSTDSTRLAYLCWDQSSWSLLSIAVDDPASAQVLLGEPRPADLSLVGFSAGDSHVLLHRVDAGGANELVSVPFAERGDAGPAAQVVPMEESEWSSATLSPDGRWLAYIASDAGRRELFVRPVLGGAKVGARVLATPDPVESVRWSRVMGGGSYELFTKHERTQSIKVTAGPSLRFSEPQELGIDWFALGVQGVDSLPDGRFLIIQAPDSEYGAAELRLVLNWTQELTRLLPASPR